MNLTVYIYAHTLEDARRELFQHVATFLQLTPEEVADHIWIKNTSPTLYDSTQEYDNGWEVLYQVEVVL